MHEDSLKSLLGYYDARTRDLALTARTVLRGLLPDAFEELDNAARLIAFTYLPGTFKGMIVAIAPQRSGLNLMFANGVALLPADPTRLLTGSGTKARHVVITRPQQLESAELHDLVIAAAELTPRA